MANATATPTPVAATPPKVNQGRKGATLPDEYLKAVTGILDGLTDGDVAATGNQHDDKNKARKDAELVRRELVRIGYVDDKSKLTTRVWEDSGKWVAGVGRKSA